MFICVYVCVCSSLYYVDTNKYIFIYEMEYVCVCTDSIPSTALSSISSSSISPANLLFFLLYLSFSSFLPSKKWDEGDGLYRRRGTSNHERKYESGICAVLLRQFINGVAFFFKIIG